MTEDTWEIGKETLTKHLEGQIGGAFGHLDEIASRLVTQVLAQELTADEIEQIQLEDVAVLRAEQTAWRLKVQSLRRTLAKLDTLERPADFPD